MRRFFLIYLLWMSFEFLVPFSARADAAPSAREKADQLQTVLQAADASDPLLIQARAAFARGEERAAKALLKRFLGGERTTLSRLFRTEKRRGGFWLRHELLKEMAKSHPALLERHVRATTLRLRSLLSEVVELERASRSSSLLANRLSPLRNASLDRAAVQVNDDLIELSHAMQGASPEAWVAYDEHKSVLLSQFSGFIDAFLNRYSTTEERAGLMHSSLSRFYSSHRFGWDVTRLSELIDAESSEEHLRIYVNRDTVSSAAFAAALVAEVATIPFSGGGSAAAMPATWAALRAGLRWGARGIFIATTAADLVERLDTQGRSALKDSQTYMDVLMLFTCLPAPARASLKAGSFYQRYLSWQLAGDYAFIGIRGTQRIWEAFNADSLSRDRGVSTQEIRRESVVAVAAYLFYGLKWSKYPYGGDVPGSGPAPSQLGGPINP